MSLIDSEAGNLFDKDNHLFLIDSPRAILIYLLEARVEVLLAELGPVREVCESVLHEVLQFMLVKGSVAVVVLFPDVSNAMSQRRFDHLIPVGFHRILRQPVYMLFTVKDWVFKEAGALTLVVAMTVCRVFAFVRVGERIHHLVELLEVYLPIQFLVYLVD
eukprot:CAMPEP_0170469514 /NCGR_PEP_ID=MMETSP0123-20130129/12314_1 /TAXON_ID=182087 /ORGANISM="Favella ehrenbergii, Strain Fehren 1" /LENGTH=160 /DNA_ID=CAMNT_0010736399 /DNA_START=63 /DNA_END=545 /DNA_ORIENTATION=-